MPRRPRMACRVDTETNRIRPSYITPRFTRFRAWRITARPPWLLGTSCFSLRLRVRGLCPLQRPQKSAIIKVIQATSSTKNQTSYQSSINSWRHLAHWQAPSPDHTVRNDDSHAGRPFWLRDTLALSSWQSLWRRHHERGGPADTRVCMRRKTFPIRSLNIWSRQIISDKKALHGLGNFSRQGNSAPLAVVAMWPTVANTEAYTVSRGATHRSSALVCLSALIRSPSLR